MTHLTPLARRFLGALLGGSLALTVFTACQSDDTAPATSGRDMSPPSAAQSVASPPAATATAAADLTPQQRLELLASTIRATPADTTTGLPYEYLHLQTWARATNTIVRTDLRRWRHATNGSGRETSRRAPDLWGVNHQPTPDERDQFSRGAQTSTRYGAGQPQSRLPGVIPADAGELAELLAPPELVNEPAYPRMLAGGVAELATSRYLDQRQRATALRVLATIVGITYRGVTRDLAGRPGLLFKIVAGGSTTTLVIDPATGELLAAQEWRDGGRRPGLFSHILLLERGHTGTDTDTAPPSPPA